MEPEMLEKLAAAVERLSEALYGDGAAYNDYGAANAVTLLEIAVTPNADRWRVWQMAWDAARRETTEPPKHEGEARHLQHALHDLLRAFGLALGGGADAQFALDGVEEWLDKAEAARAEEEAEEAAKVAQPRE